MDDLISKQAALDAVRSYYDEFDTRPESIEERINALPSAQQWIPCSERLPEGEGRYLVSALVGRATRTTIAPYHPRSRSWALTGRMAYWKAVAWMPLPKPYKGEHDG